MKYRHQIGNVIAVLTTALMATQAGASEVSAWLYDYFIDGASVTLGVGTRQAGLKVTRLSDDAEGKIVQRDEEAYFLSYSTRPWFSKNYPNLGMSTMFNISSFNADKQEISKDVYEDLGTRTSGAFIYVVPTVFYQWGDYRYVGSYTRVGFGLGLGLARYNGDMILTSTSTQERITLNSRTKLKVASSFMLESRWNQWGVSLTVAGPALENDEYTIQVEDVAIHLGYSFVF